MRDINKILLAGRLGADPIKRATKNGISVAHFPMATGRKIPAPEGASTKWIEETCWHRVVVWGKQADTCFSFLRKGAPVFLEGAIKTRSYEDKEGKKRWSVEVHADAVHFLKTPPRANPVGPVGVRDVVEQIESEPGDGVPEESSADVFAAVNEAVVDLETAAPASSLAN